MTLDADIVPEPFGRVVRGFVRERVVLFIGHIVVAAVIAAAGVGVVGDIDTPGIGYDV
jgi:hypothetical protein